MRSQSSLPDDQGRNGRQSISDRIKYCTNIQDVSSTIGGQLVAALAVGLHVGFNLSQVESHSDSILLEDQEIGIGASLLLSVVSSYIWFTRHRTDNAADEKDDFNAIRKYLNPWYRRFKTAMALGNSIGTSAVELGFAFLPLPPWLRKPIRLAVGNIIGFFTGIIGATFFSDNPDNRLEDENAERSVFRWGRDGWSKYAKAGILPGNLIGAAIGAVIGFFIPIPGGMAAGIAIGTALGGLTGFIASAVFIPLVNKIAGKNLADDNYRSQYVRSGTNVGMYVGLIAGFVIGLFVPIPGAALFCSTIGAAVGATIGAIVIGIVGPWINNVSHGNLSESSPDYGFRTAAMFGNQFGLGSLVSGIFDMIKSCFGIVIFDDNSVLRNVIYSVGGLLAGVVGAIYDTFQGRKNYNDFVLHFNQHYVQGGGQLQDANYQTAFNTALKKYEDEYKNIRPNFILAWSDRVRSFITLGGFLGGVIGFAIGTLVGGPIGGVIGAAVGTGIAGIISGAIGAKWGDAIYKKFAEWAERFGRHFFQKKEGNNEPNPIPLPLGQSQARLLSEMEDESSSQPEKFDSPKLESSPISPSSSDEDFLRKDLEPSNAPVRTHSLSEANHSTVFRSRSRSVSPVKTRSDVSINATFNHTKSTISLI